MKFKKLILSITLLASFAGVHAMENGQNDNQENTQNNLPLNPVANLQHQQNGTVTAQACTIGLAINIIGGHIHNIDQTNVNNNQKETFLTLFENLLEENNIQMGDNLTATLNYLLALTNGYPIESTGNEIEHYINYIHEKENIINQNNTFSQTAQAFNTLSLNQELLDAANAIIQAAQQQNNNNQE